MTPEEFKETREKLGTKEVVASAMRVTTRSLYNYETGEVPMVVELAITNPRLKKLVSDVKKKLTGKK